MKQKLNTHAIGERYETKAFEYLKSKGYRFVARNVRTRAGEIDGIFLDGSTYVFVEVKYRRNISRGDPLEFIDYKKRRRISRASVCYLKFKGLGTGTSCRFDCVGITGDGKLRHIKNAFYFTP
ncbi:MAG: YraN family protein [Lachnospiraceae bacterium]|nr:YraN family protein [Lachnospiraceae bacterium]